VSDLRPSVGTRITYEGEVIQRDVTAYGLHRCCIRAGEKYPSLDIWVQLVRCNVLLYHYAERVSRVGFVGLLWLFWKEE
jgi:hypothetical protein